MDFGRAVIDTESAHVHEDAHHRRFHRHTLATQDLHTAVHHAPFGLRAHHLGAARFVVALLTLVQQQDVDAGQSALLLVTNIVLALVAGLLFGNLLIPARKNL